MDRHDSVKNRRSCDRDADGEKVSVECADGAVTGPVTVRAGMKTGVLECLPGDTLRHGDPIRSGTVALTREPAKVIAVSVRKA